MSYYVTYCVSGDTDPRGEACTTPVAVRQWVERIERDEGFKTTIFEDRFYAAHDHFQQWGTGYRWLTIVRTPEEESFSIAGAEVKTVTPAGAKTIQVLVTVNIEDLHKSWSSPERYVAQVLMSHARVLSAVIQDEGEA